MSSIESIHFYFVEAPPCFFRQSGRVSVMLVMRYDLVFCVNDRSQTLRRSTTRTTEPSLGEGYPYVPGHVCALLCSVLPSPLLGDTSPATRYIRVSYYDRPGPCSPAQRAPNHYLVSDKCMLRNIRFELVSAAVCKLCGSMMFSPLAPSGYCACWLASTPHAPSVSYVLTCLPGDQALVAARTVSSHTTSEQPKPDQQSGRS